MLQTTPSFPMTADRVRVAGKFFRVGGRPWTVRGLSYGPFQPNAEGWGLPPREQLLVDLDHMSSLGANVLRVYARPPRWLLDEALQRGLRLFVDVPWEGHRCFFEEGHTLRRSRQLLVSTARELGDHAGLFAVSVGNEIPCDIVRYYGARRVARHLERLMDDVKQVAPDCLTTYVNFPTTEFLDPAGCDFQCFNVYLHDPDTLGRYLLRLQHRAGHTPLLLGEYGLDTLSQGEETQAELLACHVEVVRRQGLAGSIVFSYTDDWFNAGRQMDDWAFGVTHADRTEKAAARVLKRAWEAPEADADLPHASVVVCSYNGSRTLAECLASLGHLDYPSYEVLLVDDGSTDETLMIAARFPHVSCLRLEHVGLSAARNAGARAATGEVVAYLDDDARAEEGWLRHLVQTLLDEGVDGVGGPNVPVPEDGWVAHCVAASPGNPSHVMFDDRRAEHVPGCNMGFRRDALLAIGGFDRAFHRAGDDVDLCWRLLDSGSAIAFAPGAVVLHHRRPTVSAFLRQQLGYGRAEAMIHRKHPGRFEGPARVSWRGTLYGDGIVGLVPAQPLVLHGRFGLAAFQTVYRAPTSSWSVATTVEWHAAALLFLLLGLLTPWAMLAAAAMWLITVGVVCKTGLRAPLPQGRPRWCRLLVLWLHVVQPLTRGVGRWLEMLASARPASAAPRKAAPVRNISPLCRDLYWRSATGLGRNVLLQRLEAAPGWAGAGVSPHADWDLRLRASPWVDVVVRTVTEKLDGNHRFTRARLQARPTHAVWVLVLGAVLILAVAFLLVLPIFLGALVVAALEIHRALSEASVLVAEAGEAAGLVPVLPSGSDRSPDLVADSINPGFER